MQIKFILPIRPHLYFTFDFVVSIRAVTAFFRDASSASASVNKTIKEDGGAAVRASCQRKQESLFTGEADYKILHSTGSSTNFHSSKSKKSITFLNWISYSNTE